MHKGLKIKLLIDQPTPEPCGYTEDTLEDKVEAACDLIDSGHESTDEWDFIRALNNELVRRKQKGRLGPRGQAILDTMTKTISRYADYDARGIEQDLDSFLKDIRESE